MDLVSKNSKTPEDHSPAIISEAQGIINMQRDYRVILLEKAPSLGGYDVRATPLLNITRKYTIPMLMFEGTESKDWLVLAIRTPHSGKVLMNGSGSLSNASVMITIGGEATQVQFSPHVEYYSLTIHRSLLRGADVLLSIPDHNLVRSALYPLETASHLSHLNELDQILYGKLSDGEFQLQAADLALRILSDTGSANTDRTNRERCVNRAIELIVATDQRPKLTDLALACHCSLRTLDYAFTSILSITPKQFLDRYMLNRVRHSILNNQSQNIGTIAYGLGYTHLGHMSGSYRSLFNETPSATRKSISLKPRPTHKTNTVSRIARPLDQKDLRPSPIRNLADLTSPQGLRDQSVRPT